MQAGGIRMIQNIFDMHIPREMHPTANVTGFLVSSDGSNTEKIDSCASLLNYLITD